MKYALCLLTMEGREADLKRTLAAFEAYVRPQPHVAYAHVDGYAPGPPLLYGHQPWIVDVDPKPVGFCGATGLAWDAVADFDVDWVFWLEDDFAVTRDLDLSRLAAVMDAHPRLAQMALYRNPYSQEEHEYGGYLRTPGRSYVPMLTDGLPWYEHNHYWTTNPSLFRRSFAAENDWPGELECEGKFGIALRLYRPGTTFGVWGDGTAWVEHFGVRSGGAY